MSDLISKRAAIDAVSRGCQEFRGIFAECEKNLNELPSVQPEPISEAYAKAVFTWLLDYQIKTAELEGRYTPYEVLSWVANDWRKENEIN